MEEHLERVRSVKESRVDREEREGAHDGTSWAILRHAAAYYEAEAEVWLAGAKAEGNADAGRDPADRANAARTSAAGHMVLEAEKVADLMRRQAEIGDVPVTPDFLALQFEWSRRLALAVRDSDADPEHKARAMKEHLERVRQEKKRIDRLRDDPAGGGGPDSPSWVILPSAAEYYEAEAESWVGSTTNPTTVPTSAGRKDTARASPAERMEREAEKIVDIMRKQITIGGVPLTPQFLTQQFEWSRRLARAVCDSDAGAKRRVRALEKHLERVRQQRRLIDHLVNDVGGEAERDEDRRSRMILRHAAAYYEAEAELWLARTKAETRTGSD